MSLRIGIAGLGTAGRSLIPSIEKHPDAELVAVADLDPLTREAVASATGAAPCAEIESLVALPQVDAVYVATPTHLHTGHVLSAVRAGKHVLVEKPMAIDLEQALAMVEGAERAGVHLLVGHSHGYDLPIQSMRETIASGELGRVRMIQNLYYSDWLFRPRLPAELDTAQGGGVVFRQGSHQFDIMRILGGGLVESVRAQTFDWVPERGGIGAYSAMLTFEDGVVAHGVYNGYGCFLSFELTAGVGETGFIESLSSVGARRRAFNRRAEADESKAKRERSRSARPESPPYHNHFGLLIVSCERGDMRQSPGGLYIYTEEGRAEIELPVEIDPRDLVVAELYDTIAGKREPLHDGRWGVANLEVALAVIASSEQRRELRLQHQVPLREPGAAAQRG